MMNILMALSQLEVTGAEIYAASLGDALIKRGHHVVFLSDSFTKKMPGKSYKLAFNNRKIWHRIWHTLYVIAFIKKHNIQLVHAHSRASGWVCFIACKLTGTPMVSTVHGRQPTHASRKFFHAFGYKAVAVCENVAQQLTTVLGLPKHGVLTIRNGFNYAHFSPQPRLTQTKPLVSIIGRLTGPKGALCHRLLTSVINDDSCNVQVISGSPLPSWAQSFHGHVKFKGYLDDVNHALAESDLVIGAGRVAVEALLAGRNVFAIGESLSIGLITEENFDEALKSNFGDVGPTDLDINFEKVRQDFLKALNAKPLSELTRQRAIQMFDIEKVTNQIEDLYQEAVVFTLSKEMPVLTYHRFIENDAGKGVHGIYVYKEMFEKHLKMLKRLGYETLTFKDLQNKGLMHRLSYGKKYLMITVDDGYVDNLTIMKPLLEKYGFKAVVYIVSGENYNRWDTEHPTNPERKLSLMSAEQIKALAASSAIEIGGHSLTHPKLTQVSTAQQNLEIKANKEQLEAITGRPVLSFAYPYGDLNEGVKQQVKAAGYQFAAATVTGPKALHKDLLEIRRIGVFPSTTAFGLWRKVRGNYLFRKAG